MSEAYKPRPLEAKPAPVVAPAADSSSMVDDPVLMSGPARMDRARDVGRRGMVAAMDVGKRAAGVAVEFGNELGSRVLRNLKTLPRDVRESSAGRWFANKLVTGRANRMEARVNKLQEQIDASTDPREQIRLVNQLESLSARREVAAGQLSEYYGKKLEKPLEKRKQLARKIDSGKLRQEELRGHLTKAEASLGELSRIISEKIQNREYGTPKERADMAAILTHYSDLIKGYRGDLSSTEKIVANLETQMGSWHTKHGEKAARLDRWKNISKNGKFGTSAEQLRTAVPTKVGKVLEGTVDFEAAKMRLRRAPKITRLPSDEEGAEVSSDIWERVGAMIEEALADMPTKLRTMLKSFNNRVQTEAPPKDILVSAWNEVAKAKPRLEHINANKMRGGEKITLADFGKLLHEDLEIPSDTVMEGIRRVAEAWDRKINKKAA